MNKTIATKSKNRNYQILPIDTIEDVLSYMDDPPDWAQYCIELEEQSEYAIVNDRLLQSEDDWAFLFYCHQDISSTSGYLEKRKKRSNLPRVLVCHDMANGYHDDSYIDGTNNYEAYTFYNWAGIDIFCYFSHHFITIPPLGWINVGHKHGVKVLGTIISEWDAGILIWDQLLESEDSYRAFAEALVDITKYLKFEGWLLNVENRISKPQELIAFIKYFYERLHAEVKDACLIWYDSVTKNGDLIWQNALNDNNSVYFDITDGIFTNYSWFESQIASSKAFAEDRYQDVYIGLDVWGRNFYGGGQFNTDEAVSVVHKYGCSYALFAQAWTYEARDDHTITTPPNYPEMDTLEKFTWRDKALWDSMWPYFTTKLPSTLPFKTTFCRGMGLKKWKTGDVVYNNTWYNLNEMDYQPNAFHGIHGYRLVRLLEKEIEVEEIVTNARKKSKCWCFMRFGKKNIKQIKSSNDVENENDSIDLVHIGKSKYAPTDLTEEIRKTDEKVNNTPAKGSTKLNEKSPKIWDVKRYQLALMTNETPCVDYFYDDAFNGGSSLIINHQNLFSLEKEKQRVLLFYSQIEIKNKIIFYTVTKSLGNGNSVLNVYLELTDLEHNDKFFILLTGSRIDRGIMSKPNNTLARYVLLPVNYNESKFDPVEKYLMKHETDFFIPDKNYNGWAIRYYIIERPNSILTSISCEVDGSRENSILLGQIGVCEYRDYIKNVDHMIY